MEALKKIFLILVIVASGAFSFRIITQKPCEKPLTYRIGAWSNAFGISKEDFLSAVQSAEAVWEDPSGRDLFAYDVDGTIAVNLVYDSRQKTSDDTRKLETRINQVGQSLESLKSDIDASKLAYEQAVVDYTNLLNKSPRTPEARAVLEKKRLEANTLADKTKALIEKHNLLVENVNSNIAAVNKSSEAEFEQGLYVSNEKGQKIDIYEFNDRSDLVFVLAHELGHALGMEHNDDPESVMYYKSSGASLVLSPADLESLNVACQIGVE
jgi:hypothetical protein